MYVDVKLMLLCFLWTGKGEAIETTLAALQVVPEPFRSFANTLVDICAYAGEMEMLLSFKSFDWQKQNSGEKEKGRASLKANRTRLQS